MKLNLQDETYKLKPILIGVPNEPSFLSKLKIFVIITLASWIQKLFSFGSTWSMVVFFG